MEAPVGTRNEPARWFIYTDWWIDSPFALADGSDEIKYHCRGLEQCPETGRWHWQGVINTRKKIRPKALREYLGWVDGRGWLAASKANNSKEIRGYCQKKQNYQENGVFVEESGFRSDLASAIKVAKEKGIAGVKEECPEVYLKYARNMEKLLEPTPKKGQRWWQMDITFVWGPTGTGKTTWCFEQDRGLYVWRQGKWWDGYIGQESVLMDDVTPGRWNQSNRDELLWVFNHFPLQVEVKGGAVDLLAKRIFITSNYSLEELGFPWTDPAIQRRITRKIYLYKKVEPLFTIPVDVWNAAGSC